MYCPSVCQFVGGEGPKSLPTEGTALTAWDDHPLIHLCVDLDDILLLILSWLRQLTLGTAYTILNDVCFICKNVLPNVYLWIEKKRRAMLKEGAVGVNVTFQPTGKWLMGMEHI